VVKGEPAAATALINRISGTTASASARSSASRSCAVRSCAASARTT
jgi:hypothetical protein